MIILPLTSSSPADQRYSLHLIWSTCGEDSPNGWFQLFHYVQVVVFQSHQLFFNNKTNYKNSIFTFTSNFNMQYKCMKFADSKYRCALLLAKCNYTTNWLLHYSVIQVWPTPLLLLAMQEWSPFAPSFNMFYYLGQENGHSVDVLGSSKTQMLGFHVYLFSQQDQYGNKCLISWLAAFYQAYLLDFCGSHKFTLCQLHVKWLIIACDYF